MKIFFAILICIGQLYATELILDKNTAKQLGYKKFTSKLILKTFHFAAPPQNLEWPFERPYKNGFLGNNYFQYQPNSKNGYYHGGLDLILEENSWVYAPVSGYIEARHYAYTDNNDGSKTKLWKPWPQKGSKNYFEVAIVTENGYRFELHHINRKTLTKDVKNGLNKGKYFIRKGQKIAKVVSWGTPFHYHHVHLNIKDIEGHSINPESVFKRLDDNIPPKVEIFAELNNGKIINLKDGDQTTSNIKSLIFFGHDTKNNNHFYQAPLYFQLKHNNQTISELDFRHTLYKNKFPSISTIYPQEILLPNGKTAAQTNSYYPIKNRKFYIKMNIKNQKLKSNSSFNIKVQDINSNAFTLNFKTI